MNVQNIIKDSQENLPLKSDKNKFQKLWGANVKQFTMIPYLLLERQNSLELDSMDLNILLHLLKHWWHPDETPYPGKRGICEAMGISESTLRKRVANLEKRKLLLRNPKYFAGTKGVSSNEYNLQGLVNSIQKLASEEKKETQNRKYAQSKKRRQKYSKTAGK